MLTKAMAVDFWNIATLAQTGGAFGGTVSQLDSNGEPESITASVFGVQAANHGIPLGLAMAGDTRYAKVAEFIRDWSSALCGIGSHEYRRHVIAACEELKTRIYARTSRKGIGSKLYDIVDDITEHFKAGGTVATCEGIRFAVHEILDFAYPIPPFENEKAKEKAPEDTDKRPPMIFPHPMNTAPEDTNIVVWHSARKDDSDIRICRYFGPKGFNPPYLISGKDWRLLAEHAKGWATIAEFAEFDARCKEAGKISEPDKINPNFSAPGYKREAARAMSELPTDRWVEVYPKEGKLTQGPAIVPFLARRAGKDTASTYGPLGYVSFDDLHSWREPVGTLATREPEFAFFRVSDMPDIRFDIYLIEDSNRTCLGTLFINESNKGFVKPSIALNRGRALMPHELWCLSRIIHKGKWKDHIRDSWVKDMADPTKDSLAYVMFTFAGGEPFRVASANISGIPGTLIPAPASRQTENIRYENTQLSLNEYQIRSQATAIYPNQAAVGGLTYAALGLAGEAGEFANKVKKILRDSNGRISPEAKGALSEELGDVLWYAAACAKEINRHLGDLGSENLMKLQRRKASQSLKGSGDNR